MKPIIKEPSSMSDSLRFLFTGLKRRNINSKILITAGSFMRVSSAGGHLLDKNFARDVNSSCRQLNVVDY